MVLTTISQQSVQPKNSLQPLSSKNQKPQSSIKIPSAEPSDTNLPSTSISTVYVTIKPETVTSSVISASTLTTTQPITYKTTYISKVETVTVTPAYNNDNTTISTKNNTVTVVEKSMPTEKQASTVPIKKIKKPPVGYEIVPIYDPNYVFQNPNTSRDYNINFPESNEKEDTESENKEKNTRPRSQKLAMPKKRRLNRNNVNQYPHIHEENHTSKRQRSKVPPKSFLKNIQVESNRKNNIDDLSDNNLELASEIDESYQNEKSANACGSKDNPCIKTVVMMR